jgi:hypothetical protein
MKPTKSRPKRRPAANPYDLSTVFNVFKNKLKRKLPKYVNPYDCGGSAQYGRFPTDEG